jgi:hypothetical protein
MPIIIENCQTVFAEHFHLNIDSLSIFRLQHTGLLALMAAENLLWQR